MPMPISLDDGPVGAIGVRIGSGDGCMAISVGIMSVGITGGVICADSVPDGIGVGTPPTPSLTVMVWVHLSRLLNDPSLPVKITDAVYDPVLLYV